MKRRGFLGFLSGAAVAGPGMAKQAVAAGVDAMALPSLGFGGEVINAGFASSGMIGSSKYGEEYDHGHWLREQLGRIAGITADELRERIASTYVSALDPDLAVNRSFSLQAKVAIQQRRIVERQINSERKSLMFQLTDWLSRNPS